MPKRGVIDENSLYWALIEAMGDPAFRAQVCSINAEWELSAGEEVMARLLAIPKGAEEPRGFIGILFPERRYEHWPEPESSCSMILSERHPEWFWDEAQRCRKLQDFVLSLPEGSPRPAPRLPRGAYLRMFTDSCSWFYDAAWRAEVRGKFPHWFKEEAA